MSINLGSAYGKVSLDASGVVSGVNTAKGALGSMTGTITSLIGTFKQLQSGSTVSLTQIGQVGAQVGASLQGMGTMMTLGLTLPIIGVGVAAVKLAGDLQASETVNKNVFGQMSGDIDKWSDDAAIKFGITKTLALDEVDSMGKMLIGMGVATDKAADMGENLVKLASDLAIAQKVSPEEAFQSLQMGIEGGTRSLRQLGIVIDENDVKLEAQKLGLTDSSVNMDKVTIAANNLKKAQMDLANAQAGKGINPKDDTTAQDDKIAAAELKVADAQAKLNEANQGSSGVLSDQAKAVATYQLILDKTTQQQGLFGKSTGDLNVEMDIFKAQLGTLLPQLGILLLPLLTTLVMWLNHLVTWFMNLPGPVKNAIGWFVIIAGAMVALIGPIVLVIGFIISLVSNVILIAGALGGVGITAASFAAGMGLVVTIVGTTIGALLSVMAPILLLIAGIALLYWAWKNNIGGIQTTVQQLWAIIQYYFNLIVNWIQNNLIKPAESWGWNMIMGIVDGIKGAVGALVQAATDAAQAAMNAIKNTLGIHSRSTVGFSIGLNMGGAIGEGIMAGINANTIAASMMRPVNNSTSNQQTLVVQLSNGLTMKQAGAFISANNQQLVQTFAQMLGGAA